MSEFLRKNCFLRFFFISVNGAHFLCRNNILFFLTVNVINDMSQKCKVLLANCIWLYELLEIHITNHLRIIAALKHFLQQINHFFKNDN